MTELRIKIKEIVEEKRDLTEEEDLILHIYRNTHSDWICDTIKQFWKDTGFDYKHYEDGNNGTFRKETIRDETPEEEDAWWYLFKAKGCQKRLNARNAGGCDCIISGECINTLHRREKAETILKGKEVILELVE